MWVDLLFDFNSFKKYCDKDRQINDYAGKYNGSIYIDN